MNLILCREYGNYRLFIAIAYRVLLPYKNLQDLSILPCGIRQEVPKYTAHGQETRREWYGLNRGENSHATQFDPGPKAQEHSAKVRRLSPGLKVARLVTVR